MNIAIIEYESNVYEALQLFPPAESLYLSVSAEASYRLLKENVPFITDEDVLSPDEFKQLGDENFIVTEEWARNLENILHTLFPSFTNDGFYPFQWHFYRLKILVDAVRIRRKIIDRIIEKEKPSIIGVSPAISPQTIHDQSLFFYKFDSLYGLLTEKICEHRGVDIFLWKNNPPKNKQIDGKLSKIANHFRDFRGVIRYGLKKVRQLLAFNSKKENILLGSLTYDIAPLSHMLLSHFNLYHYQDPHHIRSLQKNENIICPQHDSLDFSGLYKHSGEIQVTGNKIEDDILKARIDSYAKRYLSYLLQGLHNLKSADAKKNFKAYIHSAGASDAFYGLPVNYFTRKRKPVFVMQHGAYGIALNRHTEYCEFGHDGIFLAWGDGIKEMYEFKKKGRCDIISTGSHVIEEIRKGRKIRRSINKICYVPGTYRGYTAYYPNGQPCLDSRLFLLEISFLSALKPYQDKYQIVYKVAPGATRESKIFGKSPISEWLKDNLPQVTIESQPLTSVINDFDLIIIDWPTTTLIQACASGAEILVYSGNKYHFLCDEAVRLLNKRAVIGFSEDVFIQKIDEILKKGEMVSDVNNDEFLRKYGIYFDDGLQLKRMNDHFCKIVQ